MPNITIIGEKGSPGTKDRSQKFGFTHSPPFALCFLLLKPKTPDYVKQSGVSYIKTKLFLSLLLLLLLTHVIV